MIRFGKAEYVPAMKKLWQQVFGDSDAYLAAFFQQQYEDRNTPVSYTHLAAIISAAARGVGKTGCVILSAKEGADIKIALKREGF